MIVYSLNVRGCGSRLKRKIVGENIKRRGVDICFIQETKLKGLDERLAREIWGGGKVC